METPSLYLVSQKYRWQSELVTSIWRELGGGQSYRTEPEPVGSCHQIAQLDIPWGPSLGWGHLARSGSLFFLRFAVNHETDDKTGTAQALFSDQRMKKWEPSLQINFSTQFGWRHHVYIAGRNINNLRYPNDTTLMAEREEELKSLLKVKRGVWKSWLKTQYSEN